MVKSRYLCSAPRPETWDIRAEALLKSLGGSSDKVEPVLRDTLKSLKVMHADKQKTGPGRKSNAEHAIAFYEYVLETIMEKKEEENNAEASASGSSPSVPVIVPVKRKRGRPRKIKLAEGVAAKAAAAKLVVDTSEAAMPTADADDNSISIESMDTQEFINQHNDLCEVCTKGGELIMCSTCNLVFHLKCVRPKLDVMPPDSWVCSYCVMSGVKGLKQNSKMRKTAAVAVRLMARMRKSLQRQRQREKQEREGDSSSSSDEDSQEVEAGKDSKPDIVEVKSGEEEDDDNNKEEESSDEDKEKDDDFNEDEDGKEEDGDSDQGDATAEEVDTRKNEEAKPTKSATPTNALSKAPSPTKTSSPGRKRPAPTLNAPNEEKEAETVDKQEEAVQSDEGTKESKPAEEKQESKPAANNDIAEDLDKSRQAAKDGDGPKAAPKDEVDNDSKSAFHDERKRNGEDGEDSQQTNDDKVSHEAKSTMESEGGSDRTPVRRHSKVTTTSPSEMAFDDEVYSSGGGRIRRNRKKATYYNPQVGAASHWKSDGVNEWKHLGQGSDDDEVDSIDGETPRKEEDGEEQETGQEKKNETGVSKPGDSEVPLSSRKAKKSSAGPWCNFCKDDPTISVCCFCACRVCFGKHDQSKLLLCDRCDDEYHIFCLTPPLESVPASGWFCPVCIKAEKTASPKLGTRGSKSPKEKPTRTSGRKSVSPTKDKSNASAEPVEPPVKRGPGRPRKHPLPTPKASSEAPPPRKRGRPPKNRSAESVAPPPRKRGRPRKNHLPEDTPSRKKRAHSTSPEEPVVKKRGPGRPPKSSYRQPAVELVLIPKKRGPGRPPRSAYAAVPIAEPEPPRKRGPGRPPKSASKPAPKPEPVVSKKRGPGRPPKNASKPGPKPKSKPASKSPPEDAGAGPKKRGPGRPPKSANARKRSKSPAPKPKTKPEVKAEPKKAPSKAATVKKEDDVTSDSMPAKLSPTVTMSRSGRTVKRTSFHDEIDEGEQHLKSVRYAEARRKAASKRAAKAGATAEEEEDEEMEDEIEEVEEVNDDEEEEEEDDDEDEDEEGVPILDGAALNGIGAMYNAAEHHQVVGMHHMDAHQLDMHGVDAQFLEGMPDVSDMSHLVTLDDQFIVSDDILAGVEPTDVLTQPMHVGQHEEPIDVDVEREEPMEEPMDVDVAHDEDTHVEDSKPAALPVSDAPQNDPDVAVGESNHAPHVAAPMAAGMPDVLAAGPAPEPAEAEEVTTETELAVAIAPEPMMTSTPLPVADLSVAATPGVGELAGAPLAASSEVVRVAAAAPSPIADSSIEAMHMAATAHIPADFMKQPPLVAQGNGQGQPTKVPRRKPGARECMQISRRFGVNVIPEKWMDTLLDYCRRGKVEHLIRMRERLDEHSRFLESQVAGLEAIVQERGEIDVVVPAMPEGDNESGE